jgi:methionyl-tRNA formyltransferase
VRVVFAGTPSAAVPSLEALLASRHDVVAVVTRPDARAGRGRQLTPSPVKSVASEAGIDVLTPVKASDPEFVAQLRALAPDCCAVVAYGALLPQPVLDVPRHGWVNLHFSLLPAWRGAAPVQHAVLAGDDITGASTFRLELDLDTGPVFGVVLLVATLDAIDDGTASPVPQPSDDISYAPKFTTEDARIDWRAPAIRVDRLVRACTPEPGAWTTLRGKRVGLGPVQLVTGALDALVPGQLQSSKTRVVVGTGGGAVELGEVRPEGKASMPAVSWVRGLRLNPDDRFE